MLSRFLFVFFLFASTKNFGQKDSVLHFFAFRLTEYSVKQNDSTTIVQVNLPANWPITIKRNQAAIIKHRYESGLSYDTSMIGWGHCELIESGYYYFTVHHSKNKPPQEGDLLYVKLNLPFLYNGLLFKIATHDISFTKVNKIPFYSPVDVFTMTKQRENRILDSMLADIKFTARVMLRQMPKENNIIQGGIFNGKRLFVAMQQVNKNELEVFLKYVFAKPFRYAGNVWKISEVFATWMVNGTPQVVN